jgi:hypothetical protein
VNHRHYSLVASRAGHRCEYCHAPEVAFNIAFEIEHIIPEGRGGQSQPDNLALGCRSCNLFKSDRTVAVDSATGEEVRLFHPRQDNWSDHFRVLPDSTIEGLTAIGRVTVETLRLNSPRQQAARRQWKLLRLFP